jgi:hypothetical protein
MLEPIEEQPIGLRSPFLTATTHHFRARLAGDDPGADRRFTAASAELRTLELPFHLAVVQLEHGELLTARGRLDDARSLLTEARGTFEHLQAMPWLTRLGAAEPSTPVETIA